MQPQESWKEPPSGVSLRSIFSYLCHDPEASRFAKLSLVSGSSWSQSSERMVHRAVLGALAPILIKEQQVDMVIVPDATEDSLVTITELIYTGRCEHLSQDEKVLVENVFSNLLVSSSKLSSASLSTTSSSPPYDSSLRTPANVSPHYSPHRSTFFSPGQTTSFSPHQSTSFSPHQSTSFSPHQSSSPLPTTNIHIVPITTKLPSRLTSYPLAGQGRIRREITAPEKRRRLTRERSQDMQEVGELQEVQEVLEVQEVREVQEVQEVVQLAPGMNLLHPDSDTKQCPECNLTIHKKNISRHMEEQHGKERQLLFCGAPGCDYSSLKSRSIENHKAMLVSCPMVRCNYCGEFVKSVQQHVKNQHCKRRWTCDKCDAAFQKKKLLKDHMISHMGTI